MRRSYGEAAWNRWRGDNVGWVREHHTNNGDITILISALRSTLLSHRSGSILSSPDKHLEWETLMLVHVSTSKPIYLLL